MSIQIILPTKGFVTGMAIIMFCPENMNASHIEFYMRVFIGKYT